MRSLEPRPHQTPVSGSEPLLAVEGLQVAFRTETGWTSVVTDVSFAVGAGETLGIVGESGSGKSVSVMSILGLIPTPPGRVVEGSIRLNGRELVGLGAKQLDEVRGSQIAMVFQEPMTSLNPAFTVGRQIAEVVTRHTGQSRRGAQARAVELLERVGVPDPAIRAKDYPHALSGGLRQRVLIAMALSCEPELLIADEPTTALDVTVQAGILELLAELRDEMGMALIFVTHDLGVIAEICDRVIVMYAGQVVESASAVDLFDRPAHPYTRGLLDAVPHDDPAIPLLPIPGDVPTPGRFPRGCRFHPRCHHFVAGRCDVGQPELEPAVAQLTRCVRSGELDLSRAGA